MARGKIFIDVEYDFLAAKIEYIAIDSSQAAEAVMTSHILEKRMRTTVRSSRSAFKSKYCEDFGKEYSLHSG